MASRYHRLPVLILWGCLSAAPAVAAEQPDPAMLAAAERVAQFIETGGETPVDAIFATGDVTIVENFAPYIFEGPGAVAGWSAGMRGHLTATSNLRHAFGPAYDFSRSGERVYFSLPTTWRGTSGGKAFTENGGWSFVLVQQGGAWRVRGYGWAVTALTAE
jgi:hypothetical protein